MPETSRAPDTLGWRLCEIASAAYYDLSTETPSLLPGPKETERLVVVVDEDINNENTAEAQCNTENAENTNAMHNSTGDYCVLKTCDRMRSVGNTRCQYHAESLMTLRLRNEELRNSNICHRCRSPLVAQQLEADSRIFLNDTIEKPSNSENSTGDGTKEMVCIKCREAGQIVNQRKRERKEAGMCTTCGKPSPSSARCSDCREKANSYNKKYKAARLERAQQDGTCTQCPKQAGDGFKTCIDCRRRKWTDKEKVSLAEGLMVESTIRQSDISDEAGGEPSGLES